MFLFTKRAILEIVQTNPNVHLVLHPIKHKCVKKKITQIRDVQPTQAVPFILLLRNFCDHLLHVIIIFKLSDFHTSRFKDGDQHEGFRSPKEMNHFV